MKIAELKVIALVAMDESRVIGVDNGLPWHLPEDLRNFSRLTKGHSVLMGRKTFESLPAKFRPLPQRKNIVASRSIKNIGLMPEVVFISDPVEYVKNLKSGKQSLESDKLWVIGGEQIYKILLPYCDQVYLTKVTGRHKGDAYFPLFEEDFTETAKEIHEGFSFIVYRRK